MADMSGQVALVTGGIRGIGLAICERLIDRGVTVAAGFSSNHDAAQQFADKYADRGVSIHQGNIGSNDDCVRTIGEVLDRHGQLDILVNNAGITIDRTVRKMTPAEWDQVIRVNLSGAFYLSRAVLQQMLDRGYGRIVNISSAIGSALEKILAKIPVGRAGDPDEVARLVEFLADPESAYITGQAYAVNGGLYM